MHKQSQQLIQNSSANQIARPAASRRGLVLVAVLIVVVLLSLAAYQYADLMTSEYKRSEYAIRYAQAKASAEAGVHHTMALLAGELSGTTTLLSGNPYDNPTYFQGQVVAANDSPRFNSRFSIMALHYEDPASGMNTLGTPGPYFGVTDEASKINLNALMIADPSGNTLYNWLMQLPNMTDAIANSIVYWLDPTATTRSSGADSTYYVSLSPGYQPKNGPINSLEELLLVQGVTPQFLFGDDINRNGTQDPSETVSDPSGVFGRGWSDYLTIYSREPNISSLGATRIYLNDTTIDLQTLYTNLSAVIDPDLAMFIVLARLNGLTAAPTTSSSGTTGATGAAGGGGAAGGKTTTGSLGGVALSTIAPSGTMGKSNISSMFDLINASVTVSTPSTNPKGTPTTTVYQSPLSDTGSITTLFGPLWDACTVSQATVLLGRINVNTVSQTILQSICSKSGGASAGASTTGAAGGTTTPGASSTATTGVPTPILSSQQVEQIMAVQPVFSGGQALDPSFQSPVWLMTEAQIDAGTMKQLEPFITTYSQVYSFQSVGYFDGGGPAVRFEAVIDLNPSPNGAATGAAAGGLTCYPRILYQRDISELLKGFNNLLPQ
jgi:hypothetical protein